MEKKYPPRTNPPWVYYGNNKYKIRLEADGKNFYLFGRNSSRGAKFTFENNKLVGISENNRMKCVLELREKW